MPAETDRYRSGAYLEKNHSWHEEDGPWKAMQVLRAIQSVGLQPRRIVEVGCGVGAVLDEVSRRLGPQVECEGYDIAPAAIARARARARAGLRFEQGSGPPAGSPPADLLLCLDVFEHVDDYLGFLRSLRPLARHAVFHIPLDLSAQTLLRPRALVSKREQVGHLHYFSRESALATLRDAGFEIVWERYTRPCFELPGRGWKEEVLNVGRRALWPWAPHWTARIFGGFSLIVVAGS